MKILLLGKNGQVGWELQRSLAPLGNVVALGRESSGGLCGDLARQDLVAETVRKIKPDVIVNAAAYTAVDKAESEQQEARKINSEAPGVLADEAKKLGALFIHFSTDYVFDGSGDTPWREDDATGPLNVYGKTKLEGENAIRDSGCRYLVFRTSWVYAARGRNFIHTMLRLAGERDSLQVVNDQHGAPTGAELIADVSAHAIRQAQHDSSLGGVLHLAPAGSTTWHGFAQHVIAQAAKAGWPLRVKASDVEGIPTESFPTPAARPRNSRLDCTRLQERLGLQMPDWRIGVDRVLAEIPLPVMNKD